MNTTLKSKCLITLSIALCVMFISNAQSAYAENKINYEFDNSTSLPLLSRRLPIQMNEQKIDTLIGKISYSAQGTTSLIENKTILTLKGEAKFSCTNYDITADEIVYNKTSRKVIVKNYSAVDKITNTVSKGVYREFYFSNKY